MTAEPPAILIVDDDIEARAILLQFVKAITHDYALLAFGSAKTALAMVAARPVALLITDYEMPEMTGTQLADAVKATSPTTRVLIVSVHDAQDVAQWATLGTVDAVLAKPFELEQLRDLLATLVPAT